MADVETEQAKDGWKATIVREGREGNRWINKPPTPQEFADWFDTVTFHPGMLPQDFVGGITLIEQIEKSDVVKGFDDKGRPEIIEVRNVVYVPYARVDTRIAYFWELMSQNPHWQGSIEPVKIHKADMELPPGFFRTRTQGSGDQVVDYVGCSYRASITNVLTGRPVGVYPAGTKLVPLRNRYDVDHHAFSRAETGAIGRALGMAGMLIIPGSSVATAEDVADAVVEEAKGKSKAQPSLPPSAPPTAVSTEDVETLRAMVKEKLDALSDERRKLFQEWAAGRKLGPFEGLDGSALKLVVKKLDKELDSMKTVDAPPAS